MCAQLVGRSSVAELLPLGALAGRALVGFTLLMSPLPVRLARAAGRVPRGPPCGPTTPGVVMLRTATRPSGPLRALAPACGRLDATHHAAMGVEVVGRGVDGLH